MAKKDTGRKMITVKDSSGKSHTVVAGSKADQKYADQRAGVTTTPPKGTTTTAPKTGAYTPGVAGTGYWSNTGWVQGGSSANDPTYAEMTKAGKTYGVGGKSDIVTPASTDKRTETQKLQDQLVAEGYMTQEEVNTGYGTYGPRTTAAVARKNAAAATTPPVAPTPTTITPAELNYNDYIKKPDKTLADQEEVIRQLKEEAAKPETDQEARDRITALFQREIDALNAAYAQQKIDATKAGLANLGTNRAQQARFGLLGSSFGAAETSNIQQQTEEEKKKIDISNQAALSPIYNKIAEEVMQSRKDKEKARLTSAEDYLTQLKTAKERKQEIADNAVRNLLLANANPTDKDLDKMAKQIGIDPSVFKGDYRAAKIENDKKDLSLYKTLNTDNGTFVSDDGGVTWKPLAGSAKISTSKGASSTPLSILDIQRYQEAYPDANIMPGDTEAIANEKVISSSSPETNARKLISEAKANGDDYQTVLNDINSTGLFSDKVLAKKILDELYGNSNNPFDKFKGQTIGTANPNNIPEKTSPVVDAISRLLYK